jgi:hypothetical protein
MRYNEIYWGKMMIPSNKLTIAVENSTFIGDLPMKKEDLPWLC